MDERAQLLVRAEPFSAHVDAFDRQLKLAGGGDDIDAQIAAMKAQISGSPNPQLESHDA